jgi:SsrA-binding protein
MATQNVNIKNKKASYEYSFLEKFTAGIQLTGTEIKSIRESKVSIVEAYCYMKNGELWIKGMHIAEYDPGSYNNHDPLRERKLLLNKVELKKLEKKLKNKGLTIVPLRMFINENGYAKLDIALAQGKKIHDKRDSLKDKDLKRDLDRLAR